MTDTTKSIIPAFPNGADNLIRNQRKYQQILNRIQFEVVCRNVPLPPQAYDSPPRKRLSSKVIVKLPLEYPKPAIPNKYDYLYIGPNNTLIPWKFYVKIPWYCYRLATQYLVEYVFGPEELSTRSLYGKNQLDRLMVDDIVKHVSERCTIPEENVVFVFAKFCAEFAKRDMLAKFKMGLAINRS